MRKLIITAGALAGVGLLISRLSRTWGSSAAERTLALPGDDHVVDPDATSTHGISISATPEEIWPWLMQIGQDRGGFYSYVALENLIGCEISEVRELREEWSSRTPNEPVPLAPQVALRIKEVIPNEALVLAEGVTDYVEGKGLPKAFTWAFILIPEGPTTRLITRERYLFDRKRDHVTGQSVLVASAIMTDKMLRTIKELAESSVSLPSHTAP